MAIRSSPPPAYRAGAVALHAELRPACDGTLRKVFSAVGVVFKGSGFYATDNRTKGASEAAKSETPSPDAKPAPEKKQDKSPKKDTAPAS